MIHGELRDVNAPVVVFDPAQGLVYFGCPSDQAETETGDELILGVAEYDPEGVDENDWDNPALWGMGDDLLGAIAAGSLYEFPDGVDLNRCHIFPTGDPPADSQELAEMPEVADWIAAVEEGGVPAAPRRDGLGTPRIIATPPGEGSCLPDLLAHTGYDDVREMDPDATEDDISVLELAARTFRPADTASLDAVLCAAYGGHRGGGEYAPTIFRARALASALVAMGTARPCFRRYFESPDEMVPAYCWIGFHVRAGRVHGRCGWMSVEDAAMARGAFDVGDIERACLEASAGTVAEDSHEAAPAPVDGTGHHVEELEELFSCYDAYIQGAFDDPEKISSGWVPVCVAEFADSEEFGNLRATLRRP